MTATARIAALALAALVLAGCAEKENAPAAPAQPPVAAQPPAPEQQVAAAQPVRAPHIYMAVQPASGGPTSVVFAIDEAGNNSPLDDPAIRITPENGKCNPQELRRYNFPVRAAQRPVFGPQEVQQGVTPRDLPNFLAMAVTSEMLRIGLIQDPDESQPQNVCTRKLWEQLVVNQSAG